MSEFLDDELQTMICDLIAQHPGIHISKIAEILNRKIIEIASQLQYMEKKGLITIKKEGELIGYYLGKNKDASLQDRRFQDIRGKLYTIVFQNPGLHLSKIAELLQINVSLAKYHLVYLQKNNLVTAVRDDKGYYKRFYVSESTVSLREKEVLSILRQRIPMRIVLLLIRGHTLSHKDLLENVAVAPSTLSYHLTKLVNCNVVMMSVQGEKKGYMLCDRGAVTRILQKYKLNVEIQMAVEGLKDTWKDFTLL
ncbi:MAG: ArsR family transcriptional regulator [Euryarchaeota archaeon]|nr:ArsR family transcriptional regulator [Euryarchaeota archaeon]